VVVAVADDVDGCERDVIGMGARRVFGDIEGVVAPGAVAVAEFVVCCY